MKCYNIDDITGWFMSGIKQFDEFEDHGSADDDSDVPDDEIQLERVIARLAAVDSEALTPIDLLKAARVFKFMGKIMEEYMTSPTLPNINYLSICIPKAELEVEELVK